MENKKYKIVNYWGMQAVETEKCISPVSRNDRKRECILAVQAIFDSHGTQMDKSLGEGYHQFDTEIKLYLEQMERVEASCSEACSFYLKLSKSQWREIKNAIATERKKLKSLGKLVPNYIAPSLANPEIIAVHVDKSNKV